MTDRRYKLDVLDRLDVPDLWPDIDHREVGGGDLEPSARPSATRRVLIACVALVVAVASFIFLTQAFRPSGTSVDHPSPSVAGVTGLGITFNAPGWHSRLTYPQGSTGPLLEAANFPLPPAGSNPYVAVRKAHGIMIKLRELVTPCGCTGFTQSSPPLSIAISDMTSGDVISTATQTVTVDGRSFDLYMQFGAPKVPGNMLAEANAALARIRIAPDFSPSPQASTSAQPVRFDAASGWRELSMPASEMDGGFSAPITWLSTESFAAADLRFLARDDTLIAWPAATMRQMLPSGVVIDATVDTPHNGSVAPNVSYPATSLPLDLRHASIQGGWEGQVAPNIPMYVIRGTVDGTWITVRVFFGTQHPDQATLQSAQHELNGLTPPATTTAYQPPGWLVQEAAKIAAVNDDPNPTSAEWVLTSSKLIAPAVGLTPDQVSGREYLVVLHGQFTDTGAYTPPGVPAPTGTVVAFTLDPTTHQVQDFGVGNQTVDVPGLQPFTLATTNVPTPSPASPPPRLSVTGTLRLPETAFGIAADRGSMWLAAYGHVIGVDASGMTLTANIPVAHLDDQDGIAASAGTAWVTVGSKRKVVAIDEATGKIQGSVKIAGQGQPVQVAADGSNVWVISATSGNGLVSHIDATSGTVTSQTGLSSGPKMPIAAAEGVLWVGEGDGLWEIRADGFATQVPGIGSVSALAFDGSLWASSDNELLRIDPLTGAVQARIPVFADSLSIDGATVWGLISFQRPSVVAVDTRTNELLGEGAHVGGRPAWLEAGFGSGFFLDFNAARLLRVGAPPSG